MAEEQKPDTDKVNGVPASNETVVTLRKAIIAHGDEVKELRFREPTAGDIEKCGNPVNLSFYPDEPPKMTFEAKNMSAMMSVLAAVPPSTIRAMHPRDWENAAWNLASFFMPDL
jgi:tail assembly chaperone E/41/14-like protein